MAGGGGNEPNLTPFIDLFSVLICFLLMTAAWLQLESMQTNIEKATSASSPSSPPPENKPEEKKVQLSVMIYSDRVVAKEDDRETVIQNGAEGVDKSALQALLAQWKSRFPEKRDVVLTSDKSAVYGDLISMYDFLIEADFPDVGISPN